MCDNTNAVEGDNKLKGTLTPIDKILLQTSLIFKTLYRHDTQFSHYDAFFCYLVCLQRNWGKRPAQNYTILAMYKL